MSHFGRAGPPDIRDTYSLLVLNITFRTSADDLFPLFDRYGKVVDIFIPRDRRTGESRGFAFVRYKYADEAQKAIERLDGNFLTSSATSLPNLGIVGSLKPLSWKVSIGCWFIYEDSNVGEAETWMEGKLLYSMPNTAQMRRLLHVEESLKEAQDGEGADQEVEVQGVQGFVITKATEGLKAVGGIEISIQTEIIAQDVVMMTGMNGKGFGSLREKERGREVITDIIDIAVPVHLQVLVEVAAEAADGLTMLILDVLEVDPLSAADHQSQKHRQRHGGNLNCSMTAVIDCCSIRGRDTSPNRASSRPRSLSSSHRRSAEPAKEMTRDASPRENGRRSRTPDSRQASPEVRSAGKRSVSPQRRSESRSVGSPSPADRSPSPEMIQESVPEPLPALKADDVSPQKSDHEELGWLEKRIRTGLLKIGNIFGVGCEEWGRGNTAGSCGGHMVVVVGGSPCGRPPFLLM
ncbi:hypothetical protein AXG93_1976s1190 [Marchantia polymorpha subsp. ruderalis]|uniref:RRM domain-containing protein n=1 Tax=Marchantia polymorpha subsp. ruderalis TaxID=1480154 RepID=A0A176VG77_MARPO|nr:hypothetical protein AXG93_1976s1190 [Marchantia polymorpha subsp. ruderalis]